MDENETIIKAQEHLREMMRRLPRYPAFLIVEDDRADADALRRSLDELYGGRCYVTTCYWPGQACALVASMSPRPDVVFVDLRLPGHDGPALVGELIGLAANVAVVTGLPGDAPETIEAITLGAVKVLKKPVRVGDLARLLTVI